MTKAELIDQIAAEATISKAAAGKALNAAINAITASLEKGEKVVLPGFGTFEVREKAATTARNPRTGETIQVAAKKAPAFKPGATLKNLNFPISK